jgi:hypothetical protein
MQSDGTLPDPAIAGLDGISQRLPSSTRDLRAAGRRRHGRKPLAWLRLTSGIKPLARSSCRTSCEGNGPSRRHRSSASPCSFMHPEFSLTDTAIMHDQCANSAGLDVQIGVVPVKKDFRSKRSPMTVANQQHRVPNPCQAQ